MFVISLFLTTVITLTIEKMHHNLQSLNQKLEITSEISLFLGVISGLIFLENVKSATLEQVFKHPFTSLWQLNHSFNKLTWYICKYSSYTND